MFTEALIFFFTAIGAPLAIGVAIDSFALAEQKKAVSRYVFASPKQPFGNFELAAIRTTLRPFFEGRRLRFAVISLYCTSVALAIVFAENYGSGIPFEFKTFAHRFIPAAMLFFLFYCFSLLITRGLYLDRSPLWPWTVPALLLDVFISSLGPIFSFPLMLYMSRITLGMDENMLMLSFLLSSVASILHNLVFGLILIFGALARILALIAKLNLRLADNSAIRTHPFAYISLLIGITVYGLYLAGL
ncbi:MAG: hypothetical protein AAF950_17715 [Pseudomonadota bacterium]